ncbi:LysM peptidoglycan-binding domain-containing protein [Jiella sp. KSK16Y-1]|uniref:LysM peptidoglycan-binding domain-containing protein n=2 Tax=Jiella mangrovi TaxID=2821407 RepID=A0ABS4BK42_9HYPH|nr:LysM peptidoglycan-binding domain-containing protein [Jiella mangrovi]
MIEKPGAPSRLIDTPSARSAPMTAADDKSADGASGDTASSSQDQAPADAASKIGDQAEAQADPATSRPDSTNKGAGSELSGDDSGAFSENQVASDPSEGSETRTSSAGNARPEAADGDAGRQTAEQAGLAESVRSSSGAAPAAPSRALRVEAVEIDGGEIFVAGAAEPGSTVRVYVDNALFATGTADRSGRFVVSTDRALAVGDHLIRVDQLSSSSDVAARVEVPFFRPQGSSLAAVAKNDAGKPAREDGEGQADGGQVADTDASSSPPSADRQPVAAAPNGTAEPSQLAGNAPASSKEPSQSVSGEDGEPGEATTDLAARFGSGSAGPDATPPASGPRSSVSAGGDAGGSTSADERSAGATATNTPPALDPLGSLAPGEASGGDRLAGLEDDTRSKRGERVMRAAPGSKGPSADAVGETGAGGGEADDGAGQSASTDKPAPSQEIGDGAAATSADKSDRIPVQRQPALSASKTARVIIRKGDTLWRISRDTYGLGNRYTVIYLANGDQIRNPDLIYPGQVFRMPGDDQKGGEAQSVPAETTAN